MSEDTIYCGDACFRLPNGKSKFKEIWRCFVVEVKRACKVCKMRSNKIKRGKEAKFEAMSREAVYDWLHGADQFPRVIYVSEDAKRDMNETPIPQPIQQL